MRIAKRYANLVLGGGGVKGVAYIGVFDVLERTGYRPTTIAGVSAGALAGAFAAAGYNAAGMWQAMDKFDFDEVQMEKISKKVPAVARLMEYSYARNAKNEDIAVEFISKQHMMNKFLLETGDMRSGILGNIITFCKEGCLFDGDLLEEWVRIILARRGVRTFSDLRGGRVDSTNPGGYRIRMTGVDCNRGKVVVLPDDMSFYGINPDDFEVAKAVRISTCVPFAFKPVEIKTRTNGKINTYNLVDGGVLDSFPYWLVDTNYFSTAGFKLNGGESKFFSLNTPLTILKSLVSAVHDIGVPKNAPDSNIDYEEINTVNVKFLDFNLNNYDKVYMYNAGKYAALKLLNR